jgi:glycosyltransferase involved in cell wall biosynthesis
VSSVSVIIPAFNAESFLSISIESVLTQTVPPAQIIVIDDGSTDGTSKIAENFLPLPQVTYLSQENQGQGATRNAGLSKASGEFIAFLDADDFWKPAFLEKCLNFLNGNPECVAVNTGLITRLHDGREIIQPESLHRTNSPTPPFVIDDFYAFWALHDHVRTGSAVIRKSAIDRAGGQRADLRVSQDLEYWGYIATFGKWGYIPEPLWVGNSRAAAASPGWLNKYRKRRSLCPTVEAWQQRILPRLTKEQLPYFKVVRGRVAAGYAHNHILGGNPDRARQIVRDYGKDFPANRLTLLMKKGYDLGLFGWRFACAAVVLREYAKSLMIQHRAARAFA